MRTLTLIAVLIAGIVLGACKSVSLPQQLPATMKAACDLYIKAKPDVIKAREWATANWSIVPDDVKPVLLKLDSYLPQLDNAGQLLCAASDSVQSLSAQGGKVDWDEVLSTTIRAVAFAIHLKQSGAI